MAFNLFLRAAALMAASLGACSYQDEVVRQAPLDEQGRQESAQISDAAPLQQSAPLAGTWQCVQEAQEPALYTSYLTKGEVKPVFVYSLEQLVLFYSQNEAPEVRAENFREISLNNSYERNKKAHVQRILAKKGYLKERPDDGCFDEETIKALKKFQKDSKIRQDGIVSASTAKALNKIEEFELDEQYELDADNACQLTADDMRTVKDVQAALNFHRYMNHEPNGNLDDETVDAIRLYKRRNAINNNDAIDKAFVAHLSTPSSRRVELLNEALEALKKAENLDDSTSIYINIPEFRMRLFNEGKMAFAMDVIVGQRDRKGKWLTNVQHGTIKAATINPWWMVPAGDLTDEVKEDLKKYPKLLGVMEQLIDGEWKIISDGVYGTRFRQRPGPLNPLGRVAYDFEGGNGEMMHGTPKHKLFRSNLRAFSHGCIRLQDEIGLFKRLQEIGLIDADVNLEKLIEKKNKEGLYETKNVRLVSPLKVNVVYLRAFVEQGENGLYMTMPPDVYNLKNSKAK